MARWTLSVALCTLALAAGACKSPPKVFPNGAAPLAQGSTRVVFQPPPGERIVERTLTQRTERRGQSRTEEVVRASMESRFDRRERGWTYTQTVTELQVSQNGAAVDNPLVQLITRFPVRVQLAEDGAFVQLVNAEEIETAVRAAFPDPGEQAVMMEYFAPDALETEVRREWEGKYGGLLGREVAQGFALYQVERMPTSEGTEVAYVVERRVQGVRSGPHGRELVMAVTCPLRTEDAARPEEMMRRLEEAGSPALNASVRCEGEEVVGLAPFLRRSSAQQVMWKQSGQGGPVEIILVKEARTESVGAAIDAPAGP